jgi:hypothetical protein
MLRVRDAVLAARLDATTPGFRRLSTEGGAHALPPLALEAHSHSEISERGIPCP